MTFAFLIILQRIQPLKLPESHLILNGVIDMAMTFGGDVGYLDLCDLNHQLYFSFQLRSNFD